MTTALNARFHACLLALLDGFLSSREQDPTYELLTPQEAIALEIIGSRQPLAMSALAKATGMRSNTMTGVVERLVRRGIVQREYRPTDRRVVLVRLTNLGLGLYEQHQRFVRAYAARLLRGLKQKEKLRILELLERITATARS